MRAVGFGSARSYLASRSIVVFAVFLTYLVRAIIQKLLGNVIGLKTEKPKTAQISGATTMAGGPEKRGHEKAATRACFCQKFIRRSCQERRDLRREGGVSPVFPVPYLRAISS
jgi:hypothetical protein